MTTLTKVHHRKPYPAIDPTSPANSQTDRTIMITGASSGIGFEIAHAFLTASASQVIILGRRPDALASAVAKLEALKSPHSQAKILSRQCDVGNGPEVEKLWQGLKKDRIQVDVLVLNAAKTGPLYVNSDWKEVWNYFEVNVLASFRMAQLFLAQGPEKGKVSVLCVHHILFRWAIGSKK
jgi:NADP-dependent 3-hydroxy acid dehydrogenase YdfG